MSRLDEFDRERLQTRRRRKRVKKGKASLFFILFLLFILVIGFGGWKSYQASSAPWGPYLVRSSERLPHEQFDQRFFSVLVIGIGESLSTDGKNEADSFILYTLDHETKNASYLLLPRDTLVVSSNSTSKETLSQVFQRGGKDKAVESIEHLLQVPIQHYLILKPGSLSAIVDSIGGLEIYVNEDMKYSDPQMNPPLEIEFRKGTQNFTGEQAMKFVRYCSDELAEIGRLKRQQYFLSTFQDQMRQGGKVVKFPWLIASLSGRVETDLSFGDFFRISWASFRGSSNLIEILPGHKNGKMWDVDIVRWGERGKIFFPKITTQ